MGNTDPDPDNPQDLLLRSKISPHLLAVIADWTRRRAEGEMNVVESPVPLIKVLIELKEANTGELAAAGIDFSHLFGLFYSAEIPITRLTEVALFESVARVHEEKQTTPSLDDSIPDIRCSTVRNPQHPFSGTNKFTGLGVIVGIIDSGINILHPVFRLPNDQTKSRIRTILDQTVSPAATFTKAQIEAAIASDTQIIQPGAMVSGQRVETDTNDHKHGTHVAGIAGGNGKKAGNCSGEFKYVGVAPEADLVIVKHDFSGTASLQAAIQFIANHAASIPANGVPAVINMSLGHSLGPHDGTDPMDQMIDTFLATRAATPNLQPLVLVASAGNEGSDGTHSTGSIPTGSVVKTLRFELNAEKSVTAQATSRVNIRFTAPQGLGCRLIPPGNNTSGGTNLAPPDGAANFTETNQNSTCSINGSVGSANKRQIDITIQSQSTTAGKNQPGEWSIELTNAGAAAVTYHAWIRGDQWDKLLDETSRANTTGSPGSAASIICVGNYHSSGKDNGKISDSSSRGPRLDGLQKPDLSAPGEEICSAKRDLHTGCCCDCCCDSYIDMSGTSMAAPHVTGAIALMLERNPLLTHQQIKNILMNQARKDGFTGATNNNDFGNGKLDVINVLNDPLVRGSGAVISSSVTAPARVTPLIDPAAIAPEWAIPQLMEGTPLWRLLNTTEGRRLYERGRTHWGEVRAIVNTQKRVATVWHRNYGPMLMHHATRTAMLPHVPLPREIDGIELSVRAAKLVTALEPFSSKELIRALHQTLPFIASLQGKTLLEVIEFFEASEEMQHA